MTIDFKHKTVDDAIRGLADAVKAKGKDYVYLSPTGITCTYVHDGQPSCIVGRVLAAWGWDLGDLENRFAVNGGDFLDFLSGDVVDVLYAAQQVQDRGPRVANGTFRPDMSTWGAALKAAVDMAVEYGLTDEVRDYALAVAAGEA